MASGERPAHSHHQRGRAVVRGLEVTSIEQIHQSLYNPDLVRVMLAGDPNKEFEEASELVNLEKVLNSGQVPSVAITTSPEPIVVEDDLIEIEAVITNTGGGTGRIEWRVNRVTVGVDTAETPRQETLKLSRSIPLDPGKNNLEVVAYNGRNLLASLPTTTMITLKPKGLQPKPRLHVLAIGIDDYRDSIFGPLRLAVADAKAFADQFRRFNILPRVNSASGSE